MRKAYYFHGNPIRFYCKKHNCPICGRKLKIIMHHKIVNSKSDEVEKYYSLFNYGEGRVIGNFDCDVRHKIFYCAKCNLEIEKKTVFTYEDMMKKINNILKFSKLNITVELKYLLDDGSLVLKIDNPLKIKKVIAYVNEDGNNSAFTIYESRFEKNYAEEKFYFQTKGCKKIIKIIKQL